MITLECEFFIKEYRKNWMKTAIWNIKRIIIGKENAEMMKRYKERQRKKKMLRKK